MYTNCISLFLVNANIIYHKKYRSIYTEANIYMTVPTGLIRGPGSIPTRGNFFLTVSFITVIYTILPDLTE